jgi:di/tricarboxylate transporter
MKTDLALVLLLLAVAVAMFVAGRPRMDAVALLMIVALPFTGVITMNEALTGFSDPNIVLIAAMFVIGEALVRTGVARRLGDWLDSRAAGSETRVLVLLMLAVGGLGALMSSTAVVAIFIPVVLRIAQTTGTAPSRLMMPLSVAALISGMLTLVATAPNLVVNAELIREGVHGFGFFSFTPFGVPVLILGIAYMLVARRLLNAAPAAPSATGRRPSLRDWIEQYQLAERAYRVRVARNSPLIGKPLLDLPLRSFGANLLAIERTRGFSTELLRPAGRSELQADDTLLLDVPAPDIRIEALCERFAVEPLPLEGGGYFNDLSQDIGMVEVILPADSDLVGQTVLQARVRAAFGLTVIGLRRGRSVHGQGLLTATLKTGDALLLVGFWKDIKRLQGDPADFVVLNLPAEMDDVLPVANKAVHALAALAVAIGLMVSGLVPNVQAALIGCLLMGLAGCVDFKSAYRSVSWKTLVLIVGMLPFSIALQRTGGVELAANALIALVGGATPRFVLGTLFVVTAALGMFISNTATAVLMAPVALAIARDLGASPYPFAMTVALAASAAFMTPISSPVNTLVVGPGNYAFGDFVRVGVPFTLIVLAVTVVLVPWLLPLR